MKNKEKIIISDWIDRRKITGILKPNRKFKQYKFRLGLCVIYECAVIHDCRRRCVISLID